MILIDTCALLDLFNNRKEKVLVNKDVAVCSFNKDEAIFLSKRHSINTHLRHTIKKFFETNNIRIIDVPVQPGNRVEEMTYVQSVNGELLRLIPDPSDAVLAACALQNNADIVTKDRHHLYTARLENLFAKNNIQVMKSLEKPL